MNDDIQSHESSPAQHKPSKVRHLVFVLACSTSFMLYLHRYTWNFVRLELEKEYGFSNSELSWINATFFIGYSIGQVPSGIISDFFGVHVFLSAIVATWSLFLPLVGMTGQFWALIGIRFLFGTAQAGAYPALGQVTKNWFPRSSRTMVQGWVASFFGRGGGFVSPFIFATVLMAWCGLSWRWALVIMAVLGVFFAVSFYYFYRNSPEVDDRVNEAEADLIREGEPPTASQPRILPFRQALRQPVMLLMIVQQFLNAAADQVYTSIMASYFFSLGATKGENGILTGLPLFGGALGGMVGGYLNDWLTRRMGSRRWGRSLVVTVGKVVAALLLLATLIQPNIWMMGVGFFFVKFFSDWTQPTVWGTCTDLGKRYSATVFSINNTSGNIGALVFILGMGGLLDRYFSYFNEAGVRITDYAPMFLIVAGLYVAVAALWLIIDCTKSLVKEEETPESR